MNSADRPKAELSFLIVSHNRAESLRRCLLSIRKYTDFNHHILVIDNGSPTNCYSQLLLDFPAVRFHRFEKNENVALRRNQGLSLVKTELCFALDDDAELLSPDCVNVACSYFGQDDSLAVLCCKVIDPRTGNEDFSACPRRDKASQAKDYIAGTFSACAYVCRKNHVEAAQGYWELLNILVEELDLTYRLYANGYKVLRTAKIIVAHHRVSNIQKHLKWTKQQARNRALVALRNLPIHMVFSHCLLWWIYLLSKCRSIRQFGELLKGIAAFVRLVPKAVQLRRPLNRKQLFFLNSISGRTWY